MSDTVGPGYGEFKCLDPPSMMHTPPVTCPALQVKALRYQMEHGENGCSMQVHEVYPIIMPSTS